MKNLILFFATSIYMMLERFVTMHGLIRFVIPAYQNVSAQEKMLDFNKRWGISGVSDQQGTTREIYDTLPIDTRTQYNFFEGCATRIFPFTNLQSFGNKLEQGEELTILYYHFAIGRWDVVSKTFTLFSPLEVIVPSSCNILSGQLSLKIINNIVMKPIPILSQFANWNKDATWGSTDALFHSVNGFNTLITIPPVSDFVFILEVPAGISVVDNYLRLTIGGIGSLHAPKQTF